MQESCVIAVKGVEETVIGGVMNFIEIKGGEKRREKEKRIGPNVEP